MTQHTAAPINYPYHSASGIFDAQAFKIGKSATIHAPAHYTLITDSDPYSRVVATCGAWGESPTADAGNRFAHWAAGYGEPVEAWCARCFDAPRLRGMGYKV